MTALVPLRSKDSSQSLRSISHPDGGHNNLLPYPPDRPHLQPLSRSFNKRIFLRLSTFYPEKEELAHFFLPIKRRVCPLFYQKKKSVHYFTRQKKSLSTFLPRKRRVCPLFYSVKEELVHFFIQKKKSFPLFHSVKEERVHFLPK